jgi:CubicO group peptidase (beta-lactamase class C family)
VPTHIDLGDGDVRNGNLRNGNARMETRMHRRATFPSSARTRAATTVLLLMLMASTGPGHAAASPPTAACTGTAGAGTAGAGAAGAGAAGAGQAVPAAAAQPALGVPVAQAGGAHASPGIPFANPPRTLRHGTPKQAGLVPEHLARIDADLRAGLTASPRPRFPGAVVLAARNGVIAVDQAIGHAVRYADDAPTELPPDRQRPMRTDTVFDLASVSKLFTSIAVMQLVERGQLDLDTPVAHWIPAFAAGGKDQVTVRHLLIHTSGLPAWLPLYRDYPTPEARIAAVYATPALAPPGTTYRYSDLNLITLGELVELVAGQPLDRFVAANITRPLGMRDTGYNPPAGWRERIAATEYQPATGRGMVWGEVHDENAWSLGGVAGHAGVFSTAHDLAILVQTILNGGSYGGARIMRPGTVQAMLTNQTSGFEGHEHGLGFELDQHAYMDAMATPVTAGHTGFTGTMVVANPADGSFLILLTNRVHPSRSWGSIHPDRRAVARDVARAVPVRPPAGREAWFSGLGDARTATLGLPLELPAGPKRLCFALWYDTEPEVDAAFLEISRDGGAAWTRLGVELRSDGRAWPSDGRFSGHGGRRWLAATADLDGIEGPVIVRWRYTTDAAAGGRGVYVDGIEVLGAGRRLFDERRPADRARLVPDGWARSAD